MFFTKNFETFFHLLMGAFSTISAPDMTQPPGAAVKAATDGRVSKGGFLPAGAWFVPVGARIKREYLKRECQC